MSIPDKTFAVTLNIAGAYHLRIRASSPAEAENRALKALRIDAFVADKDALVSVSNARDLGGAA